MKQIDKQCIDRLVELINCQYGKNMEPKIENGKIIIRNKKDLNRSNIPFKIEIMQEENGKFYVDLKDFPNPNKIYEVLGKISYFSVKVLDLAVRVTSSDNPLCSSTSFISELLCKLIVAHIIP